MTILLICMIPVSIIATGFLVLKSVQLGLKWQIQTAKQEQPELKTPINTVVEAAKEHKTNEQIELFNRQMREYSPFGDGVVK